MCGICGAVGSGAHSVDIQIMMDEMRHRGPDGEGSWRGKDVALGHRRLAIVDLSVNAAQPFISNDNNIAATVNGEIYNYPALRSELEAKGAVFQSNCDSEIVLHAYREWGVDSFVKFNGMFAFALWDEAQKKLFLVRDRLGIKPVYYLEDGETLIFASDIRALIKATGRDAWPINPSGFASYLAHQNNFGDETLFAGIKLLAPGYYLECANNKVSTHCFWKLKFPENCLTEETGIIDRFRKTVAAAVSRHLMSDVPPAAYLSAGFDSSLVTTLAATEMRGDIVAFTGAFREGGWYDEVAGARKTASTLNIKHNDAVIDAQAFKDSLDDMVFALEEPRMGLGALPQYIVARRAAQAHKVILTGHGGDELFSGYPVFKFALLKRYIGRSPLIFMRLATTIRFSELPHLAYFTIKSLFNRDGRPYSPVLFDPATQKKALNQDAIALLAKITPAKNISTQGASAYETLYTTYLTDYLHGLLVVEDKISMAHSLESRTPLLDNEMVDLSLVISEESKLSGGTLKHIIKAAGRGILPDELYDMPKRGFPTPLSKWLRSDLADWLRERISGEQTSLTRLFKRSYLERTVENYLTTWRQHIRPLDEIPTQRMWMLLCLESWLRQYDERLGVRLILADTQGNEAV